MKCSLGISNFLEEISSLSHSVVLFYFFALIAEEGFLISSEYSLELCIQLLISFLFCLLDLTIKRSLVIFKKTDFRKYWGKNQKCTEEKEVTECKQLCDQGF